MKRFSDSSSEIFWRRVGRHMCGWMWRRALGATDDLRHVGVVGCSCEQPPRRCEASSHRVTVVVSGHVAAPLLGGLIEHAASNCTIAASKPRDGDTSLGHSASTVTASAAPLPRRGGVGCKPRRRGGRERSRRDEPYAQAETVFQLGRWWRAPRRPRTPTSSTDRTIEPYVDAAASASATTRRRARGLDERERQRNGPFSPLTYRSLTTAKMASPSAAAQA